MYLQPIILTISIFFLTLIFAIPLGSIVAIFRVKKIPVVSFIVRIYIDIMRGTPLILQLLFFYFAEIFRSGYISIPKGQFEACKVLGLSKIFSFFRIYVPQIAKRVMPSFSGEVVTLVKDTALSSTLGLMELFAIARKRSSAIFSIVPLVWAGIFYFVFNLLVAVFFACIEKRFERYGI